MKAIVVFLTLAVWIVAAFSTFALDAADIPGTFAAACKTDGQWNIWIFAADGSQRAQLTGNEYADSDPRWSPDGTRIVFTSLRDGIPCVMLIDRDGTNETKVCDGSQASWSPDGRSLIFQREGHIIKRGIGSGEETIITPDDWFRCSFPAISPDGKRFAVASRHTRTIGVYVGELLHNAEPHKVPGDREQCTPRWHPAGERLLYQTSSHIFQVQPDGRRERQLTFGADIQQMATYSPDGTMIVFCRAPNAQGPWRPYVMRLEDEAEVELPMIGESVMYPDWTAR